MSKRPRPGFGLFYLKSLVAKLLYSYKLTISSIALNLILLNCLFLHIFNQKNIESQEIALLKFSMGWDKGELFFFRVMSRDTSMITISIIIIWTWTCFFFFLIRVILWNSVRAIHESILDRILAIAIQHFVCIIRILINYLEPWFFPKIRDFY